MAQLNIFFSFLSTGRENCRAHHNATLNISSLYTPKDSPDGLISNIQTQSLVFHNIPLTVAFGVQKRVFFLSVGILKILEKEL